MSSLAFQNFLLEGFSYCMYVFIQLITYKLFGSSSFCAFDRNYQNLIFFDSQGRLHLLSGRMHCSIIHMNLACHSVSDTLTCSEIRESQSGITKVSLGIFQMSLGGLPGFLDCTAVWAITKCQPWWSEFSNVGTTQPEPSCGMLDIDVQLGLT